MVNETLEADRAYQKAIAEAKQEAKRQAIESSDCIDRCAAIDIALQYCPDDDGVCSKAGHDLREMLDEIEALPPAQPEIDILAWLLAYHTKSFELRGRYLPHEVIGWLIADFSKQYMTEGNENKEEPC